MTPYLLSIVLHYHCRRVDYADGAPICDDSIDSLVSAGLLRATTAKDYSEYQSMKWRLSPCGEKYVDMVLTTPFPVWADPREVEAK